MTPTIVVPDNPDPKIRAALLELLIAYSEGKTGPSGVAPLAFVLNDPATGELIGGLWGRSFYDWLFIELLFVPEHLRGGGLGTSLLQKAEEAALARGCVGICVDSFDFQAPEFYRKHGYEEIAVLESPGRGIKRHFFRKLIAAK